MWRCTLRSSAPMTPSRSDSCTFPCCVPLSCPPTTLHFFQLVAPFSVPPVSPFQSFCEGSKRACGFRMKNGVPPCCASLPQPLSVGALPFTTGQTPAAGPRVFFVQIQTEKREYGPFCGKTLPRRIETNSNSVTITFATDDSGNHTGWKIRYTSTGEQAARAQAAKETVSVPCAASADYIALDSFLARPRKGAQIGQRGLSRDVP